MRPPGGVDSVRLERLVLDVAVDALPDGPRQAEAPLKVGLRVHWGSPV